MGSSAGRRIRGVSRCVQDAAACGRGNPTEAEALLWTQLRGRRLEGLKFRRQHALGAFILDFYCASARLVVEVDGGVHRDVVATDQARDRELTSAGYRVVRVSNTRVFEEMAGVLNDIRAAAGQPRR